MYRGGIQTKINNRTGYNKRTGRKSKLKLINVQAEINVQGKRGKILQLVNIQNLRSCPHW